MHSHDFSRLPVYADTTFLGLLTNNAVARWAAEQMHHHDRLADDAPISVVLPFAETANASSTSAATTAAQPVATFAESAGGAHP